MFAREPLEVSLGNSAKTAVGGYPRLLQNPGSEHICEDEFVTRLGPIALGRFCDLVERIGGTRRKADRTIAWDRPRRRRPNNDRGSVEIMHRSGDFLLVF